MISSFHSDLWHHLRDFMAICELYLWIHALDVSRNRVNTKFIFIKNCSTLRTVFNSVVWSFILYLACTLPEIADCTLDIALQYTIHAVKAKAFQGSWMYQPFQTTGINILILCCFSATGRAKVPTLSWLSMAPFGFPVVPEVYIRTQHWFGFWELIMSSKVLSETSPPSSRNSSI